MRFMRILAIVLLAWSLSALALSKTDGFTVEKVGRISLTEYDEAIDETLLDQPYYYLEKGGQSYVFISEDGTKILKLLRGSKRSQLSRIPPFMMPNTRKRKILESEEKMRQTLRSYAIARDHLKEETGLLATRLGVGPQIASKLTIIDRCNIEHTMDPNHYPFIIQKRATLVKQTIAQLMERGEVTAAKLAMKSLFSLLKLRIDRGIQDGDPNLSKNFGFLDLKPVQIDGGRFDMGLTNELTPIENSQEDLQHWINKCYPELSEDFQKAYEDFLTQIS